MLRNRAVESEQAQIHAHELKDGLRAAAARRLEERNGVFIPGEVGVLDGAVCPSQDTTPTVDRGIARDEERRLPR